MANNIGKAEVIWFAMTSLETLHARLGMGGTVWREFDNEPRRRGKTIRIHKPDKGSSQDFGTGPQDVDDGGVDITLSFHKEDHRRFTDAELFFSQRDKLVNTHIRPMMNNIGEDIEASLTDLYKYVPYGIDFDETIANMRNNVIDPRERLAINGAMVEDPGNMFFAIDSKVDGFFRKSDMFDNDKMGGRAEEMQIFGQYTPYQGILMRRSGKIKQHTSGTVVSSGTDVAGAANGAALKGATTLAVDGLNTTQTIQPGDAFSIAGHETAEGGQKFYTHVGTAVTLSGGAGTLTLNEPLIAAVADNAVITFVDGSSNNADAFHANMLYHRYAFALAMAPLDDGAGSAQAERQGWIVENVVNPQTGIGIRVMFWYDDKGMNIRADALWGVACLDPDLAVRVRRNV